MPEPILVAIAASLASKGAGSLYDTVKQKFTGRKRALDTLDAAKGASPDSQEVAALAEELAIAEAYDQQFRERLRSEYTAVQAQTTAFDSGVANNVGGSVTGNVLQAREIHGNVSFGV